MAVQIGRGGRRQPDSAWAQPAQTPNSGIGPTTAPNTPTTPPASSSTPEPPKPPEDNNNNDNNNNNNQQQEPVNVGHDGTLNGQTREQWRDAWMSSGTKSQAGTDAWLSQNGATKLAGNGTFLTPFGEVLDLGMNYRTGIVTPAWTRTGGPPAGGYDMGGGDDSGGLGPTYNPNMGGGQSGFFSGVDPALLSAFQSYLAGQNNPNQAVAPVQRNVPTVGAAPLAKHAFDPRSLTMQRQRY
jgi:hypothetical protein